MKTEWDLDDMLLSVVSALRRLDDPLCITSSACGSTGGREEVTS